MSFFGFILFADPPKPGIETTIGRLRELGVSLKVITGDNALVAATVARKIGLGDAQVLSGHELGQMSDGALLNRVSQVDIFAEVEPNQKERLILALRTAGHVVGYMGDGINDASALHAADVASPWRVPWTWPSRWPTSCCWRRTWTCWSRACGRGA